MATPSFRFTASWVVPAPPDSARAVLVDLGRYPQWWPQVRAVAKIDDETARVLCRSTLPHTLDLLLHLERQDADLLATSLAGDLSGSASWRLGAVPGGTRLDYEQEVEVTGRWLGAASRWLRPVMRWNHEQMMAGCRTGLARRLRDGVPED